MPLFRPCFFYSVAFLLIGAVLSNGCGKKDVPQGGKFHRFRGGVQSADSGSSGSDVRADLPLEEKLKQLEGLGYLAGTSKAPEQSGVSFYDTEKAQGGINFYVSAHGPEAILIDMQGRFLHKWSCDLQDVWPRADPSDQGSKKLENYWYRAHLFENGDVIGIFLSLGAVKLDKDSNVLWKYSGVTHHDLDVAPNGDVYLLTRKAHVRPELHPVQPINDDSITILNSDGKKKRVISVLDCYLNSNQRPSLARLRAYGDVFHTNTIQIIGEDLAGRTSICEPGDLLISTRDNDTIAVIDPEDETIRWSMTGMWRQQHHPTLLDSGNILIFDNKGAAPAFGASRILVFNPLTQQVAWSYAGSKTNFFYSETAGTCHRLSNGNTLGVESNNGRAFEVTPEGEVVWEFISPHRTGENGELIANLYQLVRFDPSYVSGWLDVGGAQAGTQ